METEVKIEKAAQPETTSVPVKVPKRIFHFSDGTLEEYSDDEQDQTDSQASLQQEPAVDTTTLTWGPWMMYMAWAAGSKTLAACDYVGEYLAETFFITTPKYYFEIEESKRLEAKRQLEEETRKGWCETPSDEMELVTKEHGISTATTSNAPATGMSHVTEA